MTEKMTIAPVEAAATRDAEFVDLAGLEKVFSIRRGHAYLLLKQGLIRSVVLRQRGRIRGRRLIDADSVRRFLTSQPTNVDAKFSRQVRKANKLAIERRRENKAMAEAAR
jgi:hypothetical protein